MAGSEDLRVDGAVLGAHEAAVLAGVPLEPLALLSPRRIVVVSLPGFVEDWLVCIARRWHSSEPHTAVWLLAEAAGSCPPAARRALSG